MLSYPSDEVGNALLTYDQIDEAGVNPYSDVLTLEKYRELFGEVKHEFTGIDYVAYYGEIIREAGAEAEIIFANHPQKILDYTDCVLACDIHTRARTRRLLKMREPESYADSTKLSTRRLTEAGTIQNTVSWDRISLRKTRSSFFPRNVTVSSVKFRSLSSKKRETRRSHGLR